MGLPAGQQRVLDSIEDALRAAEPRLASMYAIFARLTRGEAGPRREQLPDGPGLRSWRSRTRQTMKLHRRRAGRLRRSVRPGGPLPLMRRAAPRRRPLMRVLFIGQLMAALAVLGVLIGLGASMAPAACTTQAGVSATALHVIPAACRGGLGK
jgi:hypothetical protein